MQTVSELAKKRPNKPVVYGEAHLVMGVRDTIVELQIEDDGSGLLRVKRGDKEISHVEWEPEKSEIKSLERAQGLSQKEKDTL